MDDNYVDLLLPMPFEYMQANNLEEWDKSDLQYDVMTSWQALDYLFLS